MIFLDRLQELGLSPEVLAFARGMLYGDKSLIDPEVIQNFRTSGMSHLLAVSGLHVGVIMAIIWLLMKPVECLIIYYLRPHSLISYYIINKFQHLMIIIGTVAYVVSIGAPTSAVRAALMLCLNSFGWIINRPVPVWHCLLMAALVLLALDPWNITQIGFQLSFLAVAGIILFQPWLQNRAYKSWERLILLSVAAQWLTVPLVAYYFHQVPIMGWLQGLLVVPLIPFFMGGLLLGACFPDLHLLSIPIEMLYGWISWMSQLIGSFEKAILGGRLYFYPSVIETIGAEVVLLAMVIWLRLHHYLSHRQQTAV